ncbi:MAG: rod shape-determining protein MreC [Pseudomonadota bacterium]
MQHRFARVAQPLKLLADRVTFGALVVVSLLLLMLSRNDVLLVNETSQRLSDTVAPLLRVLNAPVVGIREATTSFGELLAIYEENQHLREENRRLLMWQAESVHLRVQNQSLRKLLEMPERQTRSIWITAQVIADTGGSFVQTRLIDAGSSRQVAKGMAAINENGLVGRIVDVGQSSARLLLLTDLNSRIPVVIEGSRDRAILEGDNSELLTLRFMPLNPDFEIGDRILTSGEGGLIPSGLLIGEISSIENGIVRVTPFVDWRRIDYVSVLNREAIEAPAVQDQLTASSTAKPS